MVVPPEKKEMKDAAVQSEPLAVREDEQKDEPVSTAGDELEKDFVTLINTHFKILILSHQCICVCYRQEQSL